MACWMLVPQPGIKPGPPAVEAWGSNHWTTREFSGIFFQIFLICAWLIPDYYYFHLSQEETEARGAQGASLRPHSSSVATWTQNLSSLFLSI